MESAIKTRSVLCLEVSKTIKRNQEVLEIFSEKTLSHEYANYPSTTLILDIKMYYVLGIAPLQCNMCLNMVRGWGNKGQY